MNIFIKDFFSLGVNRLSRYVFVRILRDKSFDSLSTAIISMLTQDPGFAAVSVLYSDGESALSRANTAQLQQSVPRLRRIVRYGPKQGKAYQVGVGRLSLSHLSSSLLFLG